MPTVNFQDRGLFTSAPPEGKGASFKMGSALIRDAQPVRDITLAPFFMQETPVTVAQFSDFIEKQELPFGRFVYGPTRHINRIIGGVSATEVRSKRVALQDGESISPIRRLVPTISEFEGRFAHLENGGAAFLRPDHPVVMVNWYEASAYAFSIGGRLPTEAQFEYAARAGRMGDAIYGTDTGRLTAGNAHWNCDGNARATAPVKSHAPNPWGLYDMTGNVFQWTEGWYASSLVTLEASDPVGPLQGKRRAVRGSSWAVAMGDARHVMLAAHRESCHPRYRSSDIGIRVVLPPAFVLTLPLPENRFAQHTVSMGLSFSPFPTQVFNGNVKFPPFLLPPLWK